MHEGSFSPHPCRHLSFVDLFIYLFLRFNLFIFGERGREGERGGKKHQCMVASGASPTGDLACNPGICPDWESNWQPFGSQARTQSTEPPQPGSKLHVTVFF